ncbi:membrane protein [Marinicauda pacifica]|uniref:DUF1295 domain-containing protein n=1 Tax=Marinicauda pacifica TaxID=1133559 RepID=A0A4S2HAK2_9PROT|nr:DUF1295 domain-containing protein [Marinicauda pacifica]TGY92957.1 DUF1295 domain-containing protein [Marinicauda pacifica]GGE41657.1 membrane protein [Marinicauda pacifica]
MADWIYVLATNFAVLIAAMVLLWLLSIALKDVSFIDSFWAFGFVLVALVTYAMTPAGDEGRKALLLALTAVWGLRLGGYLLWRWRKEGADKRYVALLDRAKGNKHLFALVNVFLLQGVLLWVVSLPVQLGQVPATPPALGILAVAGAVLAIVGIFFESVGDFQMARFKADPANAGKVMDKGLWRYTRHPNYFGDACVWWGLFLIAVETGIGLASVVGPLLLTFLLVKWSGAALLERRLKRSRPEYEAYIARTSGFIPMPPRKTAGAPGDPA